MDYFIISESELSFSLVLCKAVAIKFPSEQFLLCVFGIWLDPPSSCRSLSIYSLRGDLHFLISIGIVFDSLKSCETSLSSN